jgi:peptide/nickel transport system ATP-binding protein
MSLLELNDVSVQLRGPASTTNLVTGVSLGMDRGDALCLVGESGSGKTVTALSIMRLLEYTAPVEVRGDIRFNGQSITDLDQRAMARIRGGGMAMIFQECMEALNPTARIGTQLVQAWRYHERDERLAARAPGGFDRAAAEARAVELLRAVEMPDPRGCLRRYPHQLSGGMQQRVMIAMALMCDPDLLIADEPTTALDVTIQAEILRLLSQLRAQRGMGLLLITHDIAVATQMSDRIGVMYSGGLVELAATEAIGGRPLHPYTRGLFACVPGAERREGRRLATIPGTVADPSQALPGCRFAPRCPLATERCHAEAPPLAEHTDGHLVACWHAGPGTGEWTSVHSGGATEAPAQRAEAGPVASVDAVSKVYAGSARGRGAAGARRGDPGAVLAVDAVSLRIGAEEVVGLVGETGSGKSTLGRLITALDEPSEGTVEVDGRSSAGLSSGASFSAGLFSRRRLSGGPSRTGTGRRAEAREFRRRVQMVFQDPNGSLDPRLTARRSVAEPLTALLGMDKAEAARRADELLARVGLPPAVATRRPHELSGGQRQRVAVARAIAVHPKLVVADEPTSALDVSVQGQVMNLLLDLRRDLGLAYLLISHNLSLVLAVADRVGVMYLGSLVELAPADVLLARPAHPYSARLLAANPDLAAHRPDQTANETVKNAEHVKNRENAENTEDLQAPENAEPSSARPADDLERTDDPRQTTGCRYRARCSRRQPRCAREAPALRELSAGHFGACHFPATEDLPLLGAPA